MCADKPVLLDASLGACFIAPDQSIEDVSRTRFVL